MPQELKKGNYKDKGCRGPDKALPVKYELSTHSKCLYFYLKILCIYHRYIWTIRRLGTFQYFFHVNLLPFSFFLLSLLG